MFELPLTLTAMLLLLRSYRVSNKLSKIELELKELSRIVSAFHAEIEPIQVERLRVNMDMTTMPKGWFEKKFPEKEVNITNLKHEEQNKHIDELFSSKQPESP